MANEYVVYLSKLGLHVHGILASGVSKYSTEVIFVGTPLYLEYPNYLNDHHE